MVALTPDVNMPTFHGVTRVNPLRIKALCLTSLIVLSACTTAPRGGFCQIADHPIRPANVDVLTDAEVTQILGHNEKGRALCGWKT
jgi:hypothetical protein